MDLLLWETEFYAVSVITGEVEGFTGAYIQAYDIQGAMRSIRNLNLDYLQLTGTFFDSEEAIREDKGESTEPEEVETRMSYDEFSDWLDLASTREGLVEALARFRDTEGMSDYVKIIEGYIKNYDKKDNSEENTSEEVG
jgi:hypothetical protein